MQSSNNTYINQEYDGQLIVMLKEKDLEDDSLEAKNTNRIENQKVEITALRLKEKWSQTHPGKKCFISEGIPIGMTCQGVFNKPNGLIRIYLVFHGLPGKLDVTSDISIIMLAKMLANLIDQQKVIISLAVCHAAQGDEKKLMNFEKSLASTLQKLVSLFTKRNDILVLARIPKVGVHISGKKLTTDISENDKTNDTPNASFYKQAGSKILFFTKTSMLEDAQFVEDGVLFSWRRQCLRTLDKLKDNTSVPEKKKLLEAYIANFQTMSALDILHDLKQVSHSKMIKQHSSLPKRLISFISPDSLSTTSQDKLEELITEGTRIFASSYTITNPIKVYSLDYKPYQLPILDFLRNNEDKSTNSNNFTMVENEIYDYLKSRNENINNEKDEAVLLLSKLTLLKLVLVDTGISEQLKMLKIELEKQLKNPEASTVVELIDKIEARLGARNMEEKSDLRENMVNAISKGESIKPFLEQLEQTYKVEDPKATIFKTF